MHKWMHEHSGKIMPPTTMLVEALYSKTAKTRFRARLLYILNLIKHATNYFNKKTQKIL